MNFFGLEVSNKIIVSYILLGVGSALLGGFSLSEWIGLFLIAQGIVVHIEGELNG